jgi:hypothetical protein
VLSVVRCCGVPTGGGELQGDCDKVLDAMQEKGQGREWSACVLLTSLNVGIGMMAESSQKSAHLLFPLEVPCTIHTCTMLRSSSPVDVLACGSRRLWQCT